jgi:hypothetical protein
MLAASSRPGPARTPVRASRQANDAMPQSSHPRDRLVRIATHAPVSREERAHDHRGSFLVLTHGTCAGSSPPRPQPTGRVHPLSVRRRLRVALHSLNLRAIAIREHGICFSVPFGRCSARPCSDLACSHAQPVTQRHVSRERRCSPFDPDHLESGGLDPVASTPLWRS